MVELERKKGYSKSGSLVGCSIGELVVSGPQKVDPGVEFVFRVGCSNVELHGLFPS